jgi:hypothetical protein
MVVADELERIGDALDKVFLFDCGHGWCPYKAMRKRRQPENVIDYTVAEI